MSAAKFFLVNGVLYSCDVDSAELANHLISGQIVPKLATNLENWASREDLTVNDEWSDRVRTAAGDTSIVSEHGGKLVSIVPLSDFTASALKATGFNLLHGATQIGATGKYYFLVPKLEFGTYGTADTANGVLFTDANGNQLTPTVTFKSLASGVPTADSYGSAATYTDSNGYRFYTCAEPGYMVVSGITFANTCAHLGWSRRYDEFISPTAESDAGSSVSLSSILSALHSSDSTMLFINYDVHDRIDFGSTAATWSRVCDKVSVAAASASSGTKWTDTQDEVAEGGTQTYTHSVNISGMKSNGAARLANGTILSVNGTTVSYSDTNAAAAASVVVYELATVVIGTVTISPSYSVEDWGLEMLVGATGTALITTAYAQGYPDSLAAIAQIKVKELVEQTEEQEEEIGRLAAAVFETQEQGMSCGQPLELYGHGAVSASTVPDNWIQLADGGYDWNGKPSALGQVYYNVDNQTGAGSIWKAYKKSDYTLDWMPAN